MKTLFERCRSLALVMGVLAIFLLPVSAYAQSGTGVLTSNGTNPGVGGSSSTDCTGGATTVAPVSGGEINIDTSYSSIYLDIKPTGHFCTSGKESQLWKSCSSATECSQDYNCNSTPYACVGSSDKTCSGGPHDGETCKHDSDCGLACNGGPKDGQDCTTDDQCTLVGTCDLSLECDDNTDIELDLEGGGTKTVSGTFSGGHLTACVDLTDTCLDGKVTYCGKPWAIVPNPSGTPTYSPASLLGCGANGPTTCLNQPGSLCCGLTQGAYGAWNSVATCTGDNCNPIDPTSKGWIPALFALGTNIFDYTGFQNATTIGQTGKSVSIGSGVDSDFQSDLSTLVAYLPSTSKAGSFNGQVSGNEIYTAPVQIPDAKSGGSRGEGGGVLSGNGMACGLNIALSGTIAGTDGTDTFTPSGFGSFTISALGGTPPSVPLICTRRSGENKILGTSDDVCQAFKYPNCVAGLTVLQIKADADQFLSTGISQYGCSATDLNVALDNINNEFDQCGYVLDCAAAGATSPGGFTCPAP